MYILLLTCPEQSAIIAMMERVEEKLLFRQSHHLLSVLKHWPGGILSYPASLMGNDDQLNKKRPKPCGTGRQARHGHQKIEKPVFFCCRKRD